MNTQKEQKITNFILVLPNGVAIDQRTKLKSKNGIMKIETPEQLCRFIKTQWCKDTKSKSFTDWANELNADENYEGTFTKEDALDNLASNFTLNIDKKYVNLYDYFMLNLPFKN